MGRAIAVLSNPLKQENSNRTTIGKASGCKIFFLSKNDNVGGAIYQPIASRTLLLAGCAPYIWLAEFRALHRMHVLCGTQATCPRPWLTFFSALRRQHPPQGVCFLTNCSVPRLWLLPSASSPRQQFSSVQLRKGDDDPASHWLRRR